MRINPLLMEKIKESLASVLPITAIVYILSLTPLIDFSGVEFVVTALFVTMFVEQWLSNKNHLPAIIGVVSTVVCLAIFGKDIFLIPSMVLIAGLLIAMRYIRRKRHEA